MVPRGLQTVICRVLMIGIIVALSQCKNAREVELRGWGVALKRERDIVVTLMVMAKVIVLPPNLVPEILIIFSFDSSLIAC